MEKFTIVLNKEQLNIVMEALGELPLKKSMTVFNDINNQFISQVSLNSNSKLTESDINKEVK